MKLATAILILIGIQQSAMPDVQHDSATFPPFITPGREISNCPTQKQRETPLNEFRLKVI